MKVRYQYTSIYNRRPGEGYGMGTENLTVSGEGELDVFLENLQYNSSLKFESDQKMILGFEDVEYVTIPEWTPYIGQPEAFIVDIKIEKIE